MRPSRAAARRAGYARRGVRAVPDTAPADELWGARRQSGDRWAGKLLVELGGRSEDQAAAILKTWEGNGLLIQVPFTNKQRKERQGYHVDAQKYSEMQREFGAGRDWRG